MQQPRFVAFEVTNSALREANATLERRVQECTAQLQAMVAELAAAEERERRAIATDLHDDLVQLLNVIAMRIETLAKAPAVAPLREELDGLRGLVHQCNDSARSLAQQLSPPVLHHLGLVPALAWLSDEMRRLHGLNVVMLDDAAPKPLGQAERAMVFRAVRELLVNVAKHAAVPQATVEIVRRGGRMIITVSDTGAGFDPETVLGSPGRTLGLSTVYERLAVLGGAVEIASRKGSGTAVTLTLPLASEATTTAN